MEKKQRIAKSFSRASGSYSKSAQSQLETAQILLGLIDEYGSFMLQEDLPSNQILQQAWRSKPRHIVDLGSGPDANFSQMILNHLAWPKKSRFKLIDLVKSNPNNPFSLNPKVAEQVIFVEPQQMDLEQWVKEEKFNQFDLVISNAALHWLDQPSEFLLNLAKLMRPGAFFVFSVYGPNNFIELQKLGNPGLGYNSLDFWKVWLNLAGFEIHQAMDCKNTLYFYNPVAILNHLKDIGANNLEPKANNHLLGKNFLVDFTNSYQQFFVPEKGYPLSYNPMIFIVSKKLNSPIIKS